MFTPDQSIDVYEYFTINRTTGTISTKNTTMLNGEEYYEISVKLSRSKCIELDIHSIIYNLLKCAC